MANDWYYKTNDGEKGPLSAGDLRRLAQKGTLVPETQVRRGTAGKWLPARAIKGIFPEVPRTEDGEEDTSGAYDLESPISCPKCSKALPKKAVLCVACGYNLKTGSTLKTKHGKLRTLLIQQGAKGILLGILLSIPFLIAASMLAEPLFCLSFLLAVPFWLGTSTTISMVRDKKNRPVCMVQRRICFIRTSQQRTMVTEHDSLVIRYLEANFAILLFLGKPSIVEGADSEGSATWGKITRRIEPSKDGRFEVYLLDLKLIGKDEMIPLCRSDEGTMRAIIDLIQGVVLLKIERA